MSDRRIALVAEGPTDFEIINAALKAVLSQSFTLTLLQPEATHPEMGNGWGGVLKWCRATAARHAGTLDDDPTLEGFDLVVVHLDADVAHAHYADCGPDVVMEATALGWPTLPCFLPCPPVADTCTHLEQVLSGWLNPTTCGAKTILCLPAQSSGTWLAAAVLPEGHALLTNAECNLNVEATLARLPKAIRIRKAVREYRTYAERVTANWASVKVVCSQAAAFERAIRATL